MTDIDEVPKISAQLAGLARAVAELELQQTPVAALRVAQQERATLAGDLDTLRDEIDALIRQFFSGGGVPEMDDWSDDARDERFRLLRETLEAEPSKSDTIAEHVQSEYRDRVFAACVGLQKFLPQGSYSEEGAALAAAEEINRLRRRMAAMQEEFDAKLAAFRRNEVSIADARDAALAERDRLRAELADIRAGKPGSVSLETLEKLNDAAGLGPRAPGPEAVLGELVGAFCDVFGKRRR